MSTDSNNREPIAKENSMRLALDSVMTYVQSGLRVLAPGSLRQSYAESQKHATATIILHWGTVVAIVIAVIAVYLRDVIEEKMVRQALLELHRQLGMLVMIGLALRLAVRYAVGLADHSGEMHVLLRWAAWLTHLALYAMLLGVPLLGWLASNAHGVKLDLFGFIHLPVLVQPDSDLSDTMDDFHKWASWSLGALVLMHAAAALWHHYFKKDAVLTAMLPSRGTK
jgi:superoxide oxidase